ncbi:hypothetical protein EJB05_29327 [Eragrostis curvula]|uniref:Uncharacterized protein n=1 Tax=Eragrostis curvula TaxID=38414 RepID=A0A5J9UT30_9POAL|nr:hypothetical protein EJB05_29327 [Eragrostis curvula]
MLLEQALVSFKTAACVGIANLIGPLVLGCVVTIVLGDRAGLLVMWLLPMAAVGFFGYCLAVHARYKQIQQRKDHPILACTTSLSQEPNEPNQKAAPDGSLMSSTDESEERDA